MNKTYTIYDTRLKVTGLLEGSEYQFRVTAVNTAGQSQPSDATPYILCRDPTCKTSTHLSTVVGPAFLSQYFVAFLYVSTLDHQYFHRGHSDKTKC